MRTVRLMAFLALALALALAPAVPAVAQSNDDGLSIMRPEPNEPWLAPKYRSPPALNKPLPIPSPRIATPHQRTDVAPQLFVPQIGAVLPNMPNMPVIPGSGPGARETSQDRAVRCAHQAGSYGVAAGDRNAYIGSCVTQ
jgi:hypothetical protein